MKTILYVGGLDKKMDENQFSDIFSSFGEIVSVRLPKEGIKGKSGDFTFHSKGFGFVQFENAEDAKYAFLNMNNCELNGKILTVSYSKMVDMEKELPPEDDNHEEITDEKNEKKEKEKVVEKAEEIKDEKTNALSAYFKKNEETDINIEEIINEISEPPNKKQKND